MFTEEQLVFMERSAYFRHLDGPRAHILDNFSVKRFKKGDVIFQPGKEPRNVYFLLEGNVKFDISTQRGGESFIEMAHSGYFFGDLEVVSGFEYRCSATAYEDAAAATVSKGNFLQLL